MKALVSKTERLLKAAQRRSWVREPTECEMQRYADFWRGHLSPGHLAYKEEGVTAEEVERAWDATWDEVHGIARDEVLSLCIAYRP